MKKGDIVKFKNAVEPGDENLFMAVEEMRGDRVLVRSLVDMTIQPTSVYPVNDLYVFIPAEKAVEWISEFKKGAK